MIVASIWLATVASASTLTWAVISATGTQVGQTASVAQDQLSSSTSSTSSPSADHSEAPSHSPKPSATSSKPRPSSTKTSSQPAPQPALTGTWSGDAGKVTASCSSGEISLVSAVPSVGFRVQVEKESARLLAIEFEATDGYEEDETHLKATCTDDGPSFRRD
mgnify:CR=1 FL=1